MPTSLTPTPSLERVLQQLHDSEINAGVQTFYDAGMRVWIGDEVNGIQAETVFTRMGSTERTWPEELTAASWLGLGVVRLPRARVLRRKALQPPAQVSRLLVANPEDGHQLIT